MRMGRPVLRGTSLGLVAALLCAVPAQALPVGGSGYRAEARPAARILDPGVDASAGVTTGSPTPTDSRTEQPSQPPVEQSSPPPVDSSPTTQPQLPPDSPTPAGSAVPKVTVTADNAVLTGEYWSGVVTTSVKVTATNIGDVAATVTFRYSLPPRVQAGSCGGGCGVTLAPGETKSIRIVLRVAPDAWKLAPLSGGLAFVATADGANPQSGRTSWGVVFPPGPPAPGLKLQVLDVRLGRQPTAPGSLRVELTNRGTVPATGSVTVIAPAGVTFGSLPPGCLKQKSTTAQCSAGTVTPGQLWAVRVPLAVPARLRAEAPLVGLVRAQLLPSAGNALQTQASYQIFAPAGEAGVTVGTSAEPGAPGGTGIRLQDRSAHIPLARSVVVWPIISGSILLLVVVTVGLVLTLRRRREDAQHLAVPPRPRPADRPPPDPGRADATAVISAGPVDRTPTPRGPISWEWTTGEEATLPAGDDPVADLDPADPGEAEYDQSAGSEAAGSAVAGSEAAGSSAAGSAAAGGPGDVAEPATAGAGDRQTSGVGPATPP
jgi:hypothetical protein